eukprot:scaffold13589_cov179-Alexandrium_tamarense.AAC.9
MDEGYISCHQLQPCDRSLPAYGLPHQLTTHGSDAKTRQKMKGLVGNKMDTLSSKTNVPTRKSDCLW